LRLIFIREYRKNHAELDVPAEYRDQDAPLPELIFAEDLLAR